MAIPKNITQRIVSSNNYSLAENNRPQQVSYIQIAATNSNGEDNNVSKELKNTSSIDSTVVTSPESKLEQALSAVYREFGVDFKEIKEEFKNYWEDLLSDCEHEHKPAQRGELTDYDIQNIVNNVRKLLKKLQDEGKEINAKNIQNELLARRNAHILKMGGGNAEDFEAQIKAGTVKSLREALGLSEGEEITKEAIINFFETQKAKIQEEINKIEDPVAKEEFIKQKNSEILKEFAYMLVATAPEDRMAFRHAVKHMGNDNIATALNVLLESIDRRDAEEIAGEYSSEVMQQLKEQGVTNEQLCEIFTTANKYKCYEDLIRDNQALIEQANVLFGEENVLAVLEKIKNGEKLETNEEKEIADKIGFYQILLEAVQKGTLEHRYETRENIQNLISQMNIDLQDSAIYEQVIQGVREYIEQNPDSIKLSSNEFEDIVQNAAKANDNTNTTDTVSTSSDDTGYDYTASPLGFVQRPLPEVVLKPEDLKANLYAEEETAKIIRTNNDNNKPKPEAPSTIEEAIATGKILEYLANTKENFITSTIELFNSGSSKAIDFACERFEIIGSVQTVVYESIQGISARLAAMGTMSVSYLQKISPNSYYEKQIIDNKLQEQEEIAV